MVSSQSPSVLALTLFMPDRVAAPPSFFAGFMLRKLWLLFAQAVVIVLAIVFVVATLRPEWLPRRLAWPAAFSGASGATIGRDEPLREAAIVSYALAAQRAMPAVVNIHTSRVARLPPGHPMTDPSVRVLVVTGSGPVVLSPSRRRVWSIGHRHGGMGQRHDALSRIVGHRGVGFASGLQFGWELCAV